MDIYFDVDSTLSKIEGLDWLAAKKGKFKEVSKLTKKSMDGELKLEDVFAKKMEIISPTRSDFRLLGEEYCRTIVSGAKSVVRKLGLLGYDVFIMTGNFKPAVQILADFLGVLSKNVYANSVSFHADGSFASFDVSGPLSRSGGKLQLLKDVMDKDTYNVFVGDGSTDLETKEVVDLFVGFGGVQVREAVRRGADVFIEDENLEAILRLPVLQNEHVAILS